MEPAIPTSQDDKADWRVLVYDDTGRVLINNTQTGKTSAEMDAWRNTHETEAWASVTITKK